jgi:hypothetical protein
MCIKFLMCVCLLEFINTWAATLTFLHLETDGHAFLNLRWRMLVGHMLCSQHCYYQPRASIKKTLTSFPQPKWQIVFCVVTNIFYSNKKKCCFRLWYRWFTLRCYVSLTRLKLGFLRLPLRMVRSVYQPPPSMQRIEVFKPSAMPFVRSSLNTTHI